MNNKLYEYIIKKKLIDVINNDNELTNNLVVDINIHNKSITYNDGFTYPWYGVKRYHRHKHKEEIHNLYSLYIKTIGLNE